MFRETTVESNSKVKTKYKGGGSIISLPPVFSEDGQYVYLACKNVIKSYSTKTAKRLLEYNGLSADIVGFGSVLINGSSHLVGCASDGRIALWKEELGIKIKELKLRMNNVKFFKVLPTLSKFNDECIPKAFISWEKGNSSLFATMDLETGDVHNENFTLKSKIEFCFDIGGKGKYLAAVQGNLLFYYQFGSQRRLRNNISKRVFTCITCHSEKETVLTGDNTGRVLLWQRIGSSKPTQAVFHWHSLPVRTVSFSASSTNFYSGGSECVLVKWYEDDNQNKSFLPRLPSNIEHIVVARDNLYIAVATRDNGVQILDPSFNVVSVIQHLVMASDFPVGVVYDPRSKALVLNSITGCVQFYSADDMSLLYNIDIVDQNKVTGERDVKIFETVVTNVSIDKTGLWMATTEYGCDPEYPEIRLKFWYYDKSNQSYSLNTSVECAHEDKISQVVFQPSNNESDVSCVSLGKDKKFKIWNASHERNESYSWKCSVVAFYKDLTPNIGSYSSDGSLLAVAFVSTVTIWIPDSCELKCSLRHPFQQGEIIHVSFGVDTQCHLLVSATSEYICVWNLLTLTMIWTVRADITLVISDTLTSNKAVFTKDNKVFVFEPKSPEPTYDTKQNFKSSRNVLAATFVPNYCSSDKNMVWYQRSHICFLDSNYELANLEIDKEDEENDQMLEKNLNNSLFGYILPKHKSNSTNQFQTTHLYSNGSRLEKLNELLGAPSHTMAPLHLTCEAVLHSMVLKMEKNNKLQDRQQKEDLHKETIKDDTDSYRFTDDNDHLSKVKLGSAMWTSVF